jgi:hypothetical protein
MLVEESTATTPEEHEKLMARAKAENLKPTF